jgi:hypothetical protein
MIARGSGCHVREVMEMLKCTSALLKYGAK